MFSKLVSFVKALFHQVLPNPDIKKIAVSIIAGVAAFFAIGYLVPLITSIKLVVVACSVAAAYLVYTKVAMWEIEKLVAAAKDAVK